MDSDRDVSASSCCMSARRTRVNLTEQQREQVAAIAAADGATMAEVIRQALDTCLADQTPSPGPVLTETFGAVLEGSVAPRDEWARG